MKIHTVRKYLAQLSKEQEYNLSAHYKLLSEAVCKSLGIRPLNNITLAVVGQDSEYTATVVSTALKHASTSSAIIDFNVERSPETAVTINGEQLPSEVISRIITAIRTIERSLNIKHGAEFPHPSVYEVFLLGALCACSEMGVSNVILQIDMNAVPASVAAIIPQPKMIACNEIFPEEAEFVRAIARKSVECVVSGPQPRESRRALYNLCNELNCNHAVVARGEIETETPTFRGIPFTYRGFEAVAGTQLVSMVSLSATALLVIRELAKFRVKLTDEDAYYAINYRKLPGRGEMISVRPFTLFCSFEHADVQAVEYVITDMIALVSERSRRVNLIVEASALSEVDIVSAMLENEELADKFDKIITVGGADGAALENAATFSLALSKLPYLADVTHSEDLVLIVCGSKAFLERNRSELEKTVRDNFTF
jgi:folylpolyglutamate synthase/dihydropteroate synthase